MSLFLALKQDKNRVLLFGSLVVALLLISASVVFRVTFSATPETKTPPDVSDPFLLGEYYFNANGEGEYDLQKAREYYTQAIEEDPRGNVSAWYQLGRIDFIEGNLDAALYKFNRQLEYFGLERSNVYYMIGLTYGFRAKQTGSQSDYENAATAFATFVEMVPEAPWPRVDLAWVYFNQGNYEAMLSPLAEGLTYEPDNAWLHNMYGLALLNTGKREEAHEHFLAAQELAADLTTDDWGKTYPGNDPRLWNQGLTEFRQAIDKNVEISTEN